MLARRLSLASTILALVAWPLACSSSSSGGDTGAGGDAGSTSDAQAPSDGAASGDASTVDTSPIVAPADTWTWVDFPDSKCASGTPTGIAVSPHDGATTLLLYLEGGGSCHDADTCWGTSPTANNVAGYDASTFAAAKQRNYPALRRDAVGNPFAAMSMAYVPYCTGDLHAGTAEVDLQVGGVTKPTYFWGAKDMALFLARLVPTYSSVTRVIVLGTSAGGFGSFLEFDRIAHAFGTRVDIVDDSGPAIAPKSGGGGAGAGFATWGVDVPSGCTSCTTFRNILDFDRSEQPTSAYAFLSFAEDPTIAPDFGYDPVNDYPGVMSAYSSSFSGDAHAATFLVTNKEQHVVESDVTLPPQYMPWLTKMVNDDGSWADVTYTHP